MNKFPRSQTQQKPLFRVAFLLRSALVIPAGEAVRLVYLKHSKRCAIRTKYPHTTLTDKYIDLLTRKVWVVYINTNAQPMDEHEMHTSSCAHGPSIENRINLGIFHNCSGAIREAKKYYNDVDGCFYCCPESHRRRYPEYRLY